MTQKQVFPISRIRYCDDFTQAQSDNNPWHETNAAGGSQSVHDEHGGWKRHALTAAQTAACLTATGQVIRPDMGAPVTLEIYIRTSDADKSSIFFGLTDDKDEANAVIIEDEDGNLNTVPTDAAGFLLEGEQDLTWQAVGVKGGNDLPQVLLSEMDDAADGVVQVLGLQVWTDGTVLFFDNRRQVLKVDKMLDPTKTYAVAWSSDGRGTAHNVDADYVEYEFYR